MVDKYSWVIRLNLAHLEFQGSKATIGELFNKKMSGVDWPDWQLAAVMYDIAVPGRVKIFLDGFDEIKDATVIQKLGVWMSTLPKETQLVLATRPYAAHNVPMPHNRNLDLFLSLNEYSDDERDEYVKEYITAVFDGKDNDNIEKVIGKYQKLIKDSPENIRSTLGIPLESYLFCDGFETEMVADYKVLQAGGEIPISQDVSLGAIDLFERFLKGKLSIFLDKHLQVESHLELKQEHFFYTSTALYMDVLQAFAFKQAFNLDYEVVKNALRDRYFDDDIMKDLKDTGLISVEQSGGQYSLEFNHATYQEYFAALKIVSGLSSGDSDVEEIFKQYKHYMPGYQVIFQFAAQISLSGSKFLSRFDLSQELLVQNFWGALYGDLSGSADILGVVETNLIKRCLRVLSDDNLKLLEESTVGQLWHQKLMDVKENCGAVKQKTHNMEQSAPVDRAQRGEQTNEFDGEKVEKQIVEYCANKDSLKALETYINSFDILAQRQVREILAKELSSKEEWDSSGSYWALDFGLSAVGFCGECFSQKLADRLKFRADEWSNNFMSALTSLDVIYDAISGSVWNGNIGGVREIFYYAVSGLLESKNRGEFSRKVK